MFAKLRIVLDESSRESLEELLEELLGGNKLALESKNNEINSTSRFR